MIQTYYYSNNRPFFYCSNTGEVGVINYLGEGCLVLMISITGKRAYIRSSSLLKSNLTDALNLTKLKHRPFVQCMLLLVD